MAIFDFLNDGLDKYLQKAGPQQRVYSPADTMFKYSFADVAHEKALEDSGSTGTSAGAADYDRKVSDMSDPAINASLEGASKPGIAIPDWYRGDPYDYGAPKQGDYSPKSRMNDMMTHNDSFADATDPEMTAEMKMLYGDHPERASSMKDMYGDPNKTPDPNASNQKQLTPAPSGQGPSDAYIMGMTSGLNIGPNNNPKSLADLIRGLSA